MRLLRYINPVNSVMTLTIEMEEKDLLDRECLNFLAVLATAWESLQAIQGAEKEEGAEENHEPRTCSIPECDSAADTFSDRSKPKTPTWD